MKKILLFALIAAFCGAFSVSAYAEEFYGERALPKTYVSGEVSLMGEDADKAFEEKIVAGWKNFDTEIDISEFHIQVSTDEEKIKFTDAYCNIVYNNPELYYVKTSLGWSKIGDEVVAITPEYSAADKAEAAQMTAQINAATDEILLLINDNMTEFDKVMTVHDYMVLNYYYDTVGLENENANYDASIMVTKTGVCQAYALAFKHIMNKVGIDCLFVSSDAMSHAWNLVKVDGQWYHIDLTWDDPTPNKYAQVRHTYALLSSDAIESENLPRQHTGFDLGTLTANSDKYDNAPWRDNVGGIAYCAGRTYYVDANNLVTADGAVVYENLAGKDGKWDIGGGMFMTGVFVGVAEYNGKVYFNTDTAIMVYDPKTDETSELKSIQGMGGLFIRNNTLKYCVYTPVVSESGATVETSMGEDISLGDVRIGETYFDGSKTVTKVFAENDAVLNVFASDGEGFGAVRCGEGVSNVIMEHGGAPTLFFWNEQLKPYREKLIVAQ